jgi:hypothetical protein
MNETWLVVSSIALSTSIIVVVIWQAFKTWHLRIDGRREADYRLLAERTAETLRQNAEQLAAIAATADELRSRVTGIERTLKEIE